MGNGKAAVFKYESHLTEEYTFKDFLDGTLEGMAHWARFLGFPVLQSNLHTRESTLEAIG